MQGFPRKNSMKFQKITAFYQYYKLLKINRL